MAFNLLALLQACGGEPVEEPAGFTPVPELAAATACRIERAEYPERVLGDDWLRWVPCEGETLCEQAVVRVHPDRWTVLVQPLSATGSTPVLLVRERVDERDAPFIDLLADYRGHAIAAWRHTRDCELAYASGQNTLAVALQPREHEDPDPPLLLYFGAGERLALPFEPIASLELSAGVSLWTMSASNWGAALQLVSGGTRFIGRDGQDTGTAADLGAHFRLLDDQALWTQPGGFPPELWRLAPEADPELYYRAADRRGTVKGFDAEGDQLAWLEEHGASSDEPGLYERCELWTARYEPSIRDFAPRKVSDLAQPGEGCSLTDNGSLGAGFYAYGVGDGELRTFELDDGRECDVESSPGYGSDVRPEAYGAELLYRATSARIPVARVPSTSARCDASQAP